MADGWRDGSTPRGGPWESLSPGPLLAHALAQGDPSTLQASERVSYLAAT